MDLVVSRRVRDEPQVDSSIAIGINRSYDALIPSFLRGFLGRRIFVSQTFGIGLGLSVIFPSYLQITSIVQTPVLSPPLNQVPNQ